MKIKTHQVQATKVKKRYLSAPSRINCGRKTNLLIKFEEDRNRKLHLTKFFFMAPYKCLSDKTSSTDKFSSLINIP